MTEPRLSRVAVSVPGERLKQEREDFYLKAALEAFVAGRLDVAEFETTVEAVLNGDPPAWMGVPV